MNHTLDLGENLQKLQHFEQLDFRLVALKILARNWTIPSTGSGCHWRCNNFQRCALSWCHLQKSVCFLDPWGMNPSRKWDVGYRLIEMFTIKTQSNWLASFDDPEAPCHLGISFIQLDRSVLVSPCSDLFVEQVRGLVGACQGLLSCRIMHGSFQTPGAKVNVVCVSHTLFQRACNVKNSFLLSDLDSKHRGGGIGRTRKTYNLVFITELHGAMAYSWVHCQRSYSWIGRISRLIIFGFRVCQAVVSDVIVFHESRICIIVIKLV